MELSSVRIEVPAQIWLSFKSKCPEQGHKTMVSVIIKLVKLFNKYGNQVFDIDNHTFR